MKINKIVVALAFLLSCTVDGAVMCKGKIERVYKWSDKEFMSVYLGEQNGNRWIALPTKSDEAMALTAFAAGKKVDFYWSAPDVVSCKDGWSNNRVFEGYFQVYAE
ncbi:hypothetical protein [Rheinheimera sp.]|uniref:hypothetical protein n=1 Tax=Rheinheimera sp. TaxID=1869214 RepID=UPI0040488A10